MALFNLNMEEVEKEVERFGKGAELEPGVFKVKVDRIYIDKTQSGAKFFAIEAGNIKLTKFSVERMVENKEGNNRMSNGRLFTGIILLQKIAKIKGLTLNDLKPEKGFVQRWDESIEEVQDIPALKAVEIVIGLRKIIDEYDGKETTKFEIVDIINPSDEEAINKLKAKIEKKPEIDRRNKKTITQSNNSNSNSVDGIPF